MSIEAGQRWSHYRLIEQIGQGAMGEVWRAEDTRLHRHVALKFVFDDAGRSVDRHLREARAASALNHPHIRAIHDIGEWNGRRFIVMELRDGRVLSERIAGLPGRPADETTRTALRPGHARARSRDDPCGQACS